MYTHRHVRQLIGQHVQCHTHYGTFQGVIKHCTKDHIILAPAPSYGESAYGYGRSPELMSDDSGRLWGMGGPMGPGGPGGPVGPGGPMGPGGGPNSPWHFAIPLAAILGITAVGMHWW